MGMPAITQEWTVDMLDALPDDGQRHEIIDGVLFVTPGPGEMHQDVVGELYGLLRDYLMGSDIGKVMVSPSVAVQVRVSAWMEPSRAKARPCQNFSAGWTGVRVRS